jgi:predicted transcriptional regulator of viral defense system
MTLMPGTAYRTIYDVAEDQHGHVTTAQAAEMGVSKQALHQMMRRGELERISWGVYRLVRFPRSENDLYMATTLWPLSTRGVISNESALALYELSDVNPAKIHVTVPKSFRLQREVPRGMVIHHADLRDADIGYHDGIPVTTPERTIRDCHAAHLGPALIRQAINDGTRAGYLRRSQAKALEQELLGRSAPSSPA